jgi:hypothetical protein
VHTADGILCHCRFEAGEAELLMLPADERPFSTLMLKLADYYTVQYQLERATKYCMAMQTRRQAQGDTHPDTLRSIDSLGRLYTAKGQYADAVLLLQEALEGFRTTLGSDSKATLDCMLHLATAEVGQFSTSN